MFLKKLIVVVFVIFIIDRVYTSDLQFSENRCLGKGHNTTYVGEVCCKNQSLTQGIGTSAQWSKCAVAPTDDDETYSATMWRIYICMLKMVVPKDQETISLVEFGKAMTAEYPDALKTEINEKVKDSTPQYASKKDGSSTGVDFKDMEKIDRLRTTYFDIEKQICGLDIQNGQQRNMTGIIGCSTSEERFHRGGTCCNNKTLPIEDFNYNLYNPLKPQNCNNTLSKFKEKLESINSTRLNDYLFECTASCHLIQNGVVSVEDLISFKVTDEIPTENIVKEFMPKYHSKSMQKKAQDYVKSNFSAELAVNDYLMASLIPTADGKTNGTLPAEMHGCAVHNELFIFAIAQYAVECEEHKSLFG